jgi:hypothetical protein
MPSKIRELIAQLERNGFVDRRQRQSQELRTSRRCETDNFGKAWRGRTEIPRKTGAQGFEADQETMNTIADQYEKIVYWSDEDQCYIGMCPELFYGGVHGDDP